MWSETMEFGFYEVCYEGNFEVYMDGLIWYKPGSFKDGSKDFRLESLGVNYVWGLCWPPHFYDVRNLMEEDRFVDSQFI